MHKPTSTHCGPQFLILPLLSLLAKKKFTSRKKGQQAILQTEAQDEG